MPLLAMLALIANGFLAFESTTRQRLNHFERAGQRLEAHDVPKPLRPLALRPGRKRVRDLPDLASTCRMLGKKPLGVQKDYLLTAT